MKRLLFVLTILLAINLFARMNPFEPTTTFHEQQKKYFDLEKQEKLKQLALEKQKKIALLAQQEKEEKAAQLAIVHAQQVAREKQEKIKNQKKAQQIKDHKRKQKASAHKKRYKILPFVHISLLQESLEIFIDKRYKLINQDILEDQKKFLFDFRATESFYTVRKKLKNKNFKSLSVGTHMEKNFFRVVVTLKDDILQYRESINDNKNYIKIEKLK